MIHIKTVLQNKINELKQPENIEAREKAKRIVLDIISRGKKR
jgi:hypothetical protein